METPTARDTRTASIQIYLDREHDAVFSHGRFGDLFSAYLDHVRQWESVPPEPALSMMQKFLAAATLHLCCRPRDEMTAWTLNLVAPPINFFSTADNSESMITGRVITECVKTSNQHRLFVESKRANGQHSESMVEVEGEDVLGMFAQYYLKSEQTQARLLMLAPEEFLLVFGLPNVSAEWLASINHQTARQYLSGESQLIQERAFRFECGCNPLKILGALRGLFKDNPEELFLGEEQVQTFCPRCGRHWWISREDFFSKDKQIGIS